MAAWGQPFVDGGSVALGLLPNLETAQQERSVLLADEQKSTGEGGKRSVCVEHQNGFL
jgi:hypothetical protein